MAITTQTGLVAALPGDRLHLYKTSISGKIWTSYWFQGGNPTVGTSPTDKASGGDVPTSTTTGALPLKDAGAGNQLYLYRFKAAMSSNIGLWVADRVWECGGFAGNITSTQTVTSPVAQTRPDANGVDVELWLELNAAWGGTATTVTVTYTNAAGTGSRTATCVIAANQALNAGSLFPFALQAGDTGVQSVQSLALTPSTGTAGNGSLILIRRLGLASVPALQTYAQADPLGLLLPQITNGACLFFLSENNGSSVTNGIVTAFLDIIEG